MSLSVSDLATHAPVLGKKDLLFDYRVAYLSRQLSLVSRKEVFMGRAKFGIFGDGKEVAQVAMARAFLEGDFRSGYYRDQTFMLASGLLTPEAFFAQLYAHADLKADPASGGRMMSAHFATRMLNKQGEWTSQKDKKHSSADISPTGGQMPRLLGLAFASKLYRHNKALYRYKEFSNKGLEVAWGTIGNAGTSEGLFFETMNAAAVLQVPLVVSVWDDAYGISVPAHYHSAKGSISAAMQGFKRSSGTSDQSLELYTVKGWDYPSLLKVYAEAGALARTAHLPSLIHVQEMTQPQGHSTSGSHERYKSKARLAWEEKYDCIARMRAWLLSEGVSNAKELEALEADARAHIQAARKTAWNAYVSDNQKAQSEVLQHLKELNLPSALLSKLAADLSTKVAPLKSNAMRAARRALYAVHQNKPPAQAQLAQWVQNKQAEYFSQYNSQLYSSSQHAALQAKEVAPVYEAEPKQVDGHEILCACFDSMLAREPRFFAIGEDVGRIGDVNQGFAGLQKKYGALRVDDTGIREATIIGQGIGAAMRGLKPLVEIQYLDYMLFALQTLSDDLCTLRYRSAGGQQAPLIVRTRGHRLEGIWHSGSPMGMLIHSLRGMYILVPRNMTRAAAFYNVLLESDDPALVIERLNAYRIKEPLPKNLSAIKYPIGQAEILRPGNDITCLTYGAMCTIVLDAAERLQTYGISVEVIDAQCLIPFDRTQIVRQSLARTHRLLVADEDVPGGASAYLLQQVLEKQQGYYELDAPPRTLTAQAHRPAYGSDGDYFSKPNTEDAFEALYDLMHESDPKRYPNLYP